MRSFWVETLIVSFDSIEKSLQQPSLYLSCQPGTKVRCRQYQKRLSSLEDATRKINEVAAKESIMLHTYLTTPWHFRYPIIGAPMAYVG